MTKHTYVGLI